MLQKNKVRQGGMYQFARAAKTKYHGMDCFNNESVGVPG